MRARPLTIPDQLVGLDMDDTDRPDLADPRLRVASAVLYVAMALMVKGFPS